MYAVIQTGGKQYKVEAGQRLKVEQLAVEAGSDLILDHVLCIANGDQIQIGAPLLQSAKVNAKVIGHGRGEKVMIFKMRRRKHYKKSQGHRQNFTEIEIQSINP